MRRFFVHLFLSLAMFSLITAPAFAGFDLRGSQKIDLGVKSLDTAVSADGKWTFVLTEGGNIRVLTWRGELSQVIETGKAYSRIEFSAAGSRLILSGGGAKDIMVLSLDMVHALDIAGSPSKGPDDAQVVVAYFADYQ
jgi:hypothetical protein